MDEHESLNKAEELIDSGEIEEAQKTLDAVKEKSGRKYYLQGKLFIAKNWYTEARKQFKKAVKAEPDNEQYNKALEDLEAFCKSEEGKQMKTVQMGNKDGLAECCILGCCEVCGTGICEAICDGCS